MPTFRVEKNRDYTVISNIVFKDRRLSWKARGALTEMLSLPDDWDYSVEGLAALGSDGLSATRAAIKELEKCGYLKRAAIRECGKIVDWEYSVYENPQVENPQVGNQQVENPQVGNQQVENPLVENQTQLNTNTLSTKRQSTNGLSTCGSSYGEKTGKKCAAKKYGEYNNVVLTDSDIEKLKIEFPRDWQDRIERLSEYMESTGKKYKNHLATIRSWAKNESQKQPQLGRGYQGYQRQKSFTEIADEMQQEMLEQQERRHIIDI